MRTLRNSTALLERPSTDVEFGASQAAFELRYELRPPAEESPATPDAAQPEGRQLVTSAAIAALTNPLCHTAPEDDLGELITDVMDLPEAQRSTVRTIVSGMLRSVTAKPSMIFALVAFVATLGVGLNTDVGRAAAHTVAETTRDVGRAVVKRAVDVVAPAVRRLRPTTNDTPRKVLGVGPSSTQRSTPATAKTVAAPASRTAGARGRTVHALAVSAGGAASAVDGRHPGRGGVGERAGHGHHRNGAAGAHRHGRSHATGHGTSHAGKHVKSVKHGKNAKHGKNGKGISKRSGRHR
jgi:hypothetical protein